MCRLQIKKEKQQNYTHKSGFLEKRNNGNQKRERLIFFFRITEYTSTNTSSRTGSLCWGFMVYCICHISRKVFFGQY